MTETSWVVVQRFLKTALGIPPQVLDFVAVRDITLRCISGYSNKTISRYVKQDIAYVSEVLQQFLDFDGWPDDLDFSPVAIYKRKKVFMEYYAEVLMISPATNDFMIRLSFEICRKFFRMEKEIEKYYV